MSPFLTFSLTERVVVLRVPEFHDSMMSRCTYLQRHARTASTTRRWAEVRIWLEACSFLELVTILRKIEIVGIGPGRTMMMRDTGG
jgi:hypothetical protein